MNSSLKFIVTKNYIFNKVNKLQKKFNESFQNEVNEIKTKFNGNIINH